MAPPPAPSYSAHLGVWIEMPPGGELVGEGIGQLMRMILENACSGGARCTIFAPFWVAPVLRRYLDDYSPAVRERLTVQYARRMRPFLWRFSGHTTARHRRMRLWRPLIPNWRPLVRRLTRLVVSQPMVSVALATPFALFAGIVLLPLVAIGVGLIWLARIANGLASKAVTLLRGMHQRYGRAVYELIREDEYARMLKAANRRTDIDCWFVPNPGWSTAAELKAPRVCLFPDFVFAEHWTGFTAHIMAEARKRFSTLAQSGPHYVCFSRYVMEAHAQAYFGIPKPKLTLIPHAPILYDVPTGSQKREVLAQYLAERFEPSRATSLIEQRHIYPYLRSLDLGNVKYLFVSTQLRPYKNVLRVARAVERLIRYHHFEIKLVLTGTLDFVHMDPDLARFVQANALWMDILSIPRVPKNIHALLYRFAAMTVHPSFFEGGFPFVFAESVGVGTPCLLARSAAVAEEFSPEELRSFTFDPYLTPDRLAIVLKEAIERRERLLAEQQSVLQRMVGRTWQQVTGEYMAAFEMAAFAVQAERRGQSDSNRLLTQSGRG